MRTAGLLRIFLHAVLHRRAQVYGIWLLLALAAVGSLAVFGLHIDTDRQKLVSEENVDGARFARFAELFGATLNAVVVIEGSEPAALTQFCDDLAARLATRTDRIGAVFYRIDPADFRKFALLYAPPDSLATLGEQLRTLGPTLGDDPVKIQGLVGALESANRFLARLEDGDTEGLGPLADIKADGEAAPKNVTEAFDALRQALASSDWSELELLKRAGVKELEAAGIDENGYLTANDGTMAFVFVQPRGGDEQAMTITAFVDAIEEEAHALQAGGVEFGITGYPAHIATETRLVVRDVWYTAAASLIGVILLFFVFYGSFAKTLIMLIPLLAGAIVTVGVVAATIGRINLLSSAFFAFLVGLGVDFSIHLLTRFVESRAQGASAEESAEAALLRTGPGIVTGALTTIAAFAALTTSDFTGQAELGLLAAGGLFWVLLGALTLTPCLLIDYHHWRERRGLAPPAAKIRSPKPGLVSKLIRQQVWFPAGALALTLLLAPHIEPVQFNFDVSKLLPADAPAVTAYDKLRANDVFSPDFAVMIAEDEASARELTRRLSERPDLVARVESAVTYLPPGQNERLPGIQTIYETLQTFPEMSFLAPDSPSSAALAKALRELAERASVDLPLTLQMNGKKELVPFSQAIGKEAEALAADLEAGKYPGAANNLATLDAKLAATLADVGSYFDQEPKLMGPRDLPGPIRDAYYREVNGQEYFAVRIYPKGDIADKEFMDGFRAFVLDIDPEVTGLPMTLLAWGVLFREGLERAAFVALFIILFLVWFDFRRLIDALLAMFPLVLGAVWMVGAMNVLGIEYNFASVIALPLILGIGIDSGVHVVHRFREGTPASRLPRTTGKAIGVSSATTMLAFGTLAAAQHRGLESLGQTLVLGVAGCLVSAVWVLPAVLEFLSQRGWLTPPDDAPGLSDTPASAAS